MSVYFWHTAHHGIAVFLTASSIPPSTAQNWECYRRENESLKELAVNRGDKAPWWVGSKVQNGGKAFGYCGVCGTSYLLVPQAAVAAGAGGASCESEIPSGFEQAPALSAPYLYVFISWWKLSCRTGTKLGNSDAWASLFTTAKWKTENPKLVKNSVFNTVLRKWIPAAGAHQTPALTSALTALWPTVQMPPG